MCIRFIHEGIKDHECMACDKAFCEAGVLKRHIWLVHEGVKNHKCETCGKAFGLGSSLKKYIRTVHKGVINTHEKHFA